MNNKIALVVMDGVGLNPTGYGDAFKSAKTPTLDYLMENHPWISIAAHGKAVGLPSDSDMGNSEVGHNALGSGQIYAQGAKLVNEAIATGEIFTTDSWKLVVNNVKNHNSTLHYLGLLSDGNVHSNISHLFSMIRESKKAGVHKVRVHILLDGRDVDPTSGLKYIEDLETVLNELNDSSFDARIASGGGRMAITMDRYEADWPMVEAGWRTHVLGEGRQFASAKEAYNTLREETQKLDQDLPPFVIAEEGEAVGTIKDGDSVVYFNFRGDRAIEISMAFEGGEDFKFFERVRVPKVVYAGMLEYDGDLHIPSHYLVNPPAIKNTMTEFMIEKKVMEYAISETQKFGHVTYFWNGNRSGYINEDYELYEEILSDLVPFDERPWMKCAEITDKMISQMESGKYTFLRCNYPNGDMVGHTGNYRAVEISMEALDLSLSRLVKAAKKTGYTLLITADHGNADDMYQKKPKDGSAPTPKTSHSLNPVLFIIVTPNGEKVAFKEGKEFGLSNVAATVATLMGYTPWDCWNESMILTE